MDLETSLKIREIEVETFRPYYRKRVSAEIDSGTMDMESKIAVKEKRIDALGSWISSTFILKKGEGPSFGFRQRLWFLYWSKKNIRLKFPFM